MIEDDVNLFVESLSGCPLIQLKGEKYKFCLNSLTEQVPPASSRLYKAVARLLFRVGVCSGIFHDGPCGEGDYALVSEEDRGSPIATAVLLEVGGTLSLARWLLPVERPEIPQVPLEMEYTRQTLYLMGLTRDESSRELIIIDDFVSTGGTLVALIKGIESQTNHTVKGILTVADKGYGGPQRVFVETGHTVHSLAKLNMEGETSIVEEVNLPDVSLHGIRCRNSQKR